MALEYSGIKEYCCGGCKQYAFKILDKNGKFYYILKIRGISLTAEVAEQLHFDIFKQMVLECDEKQLTLPVTRIVPHRSGHVYTVHMTKIYRTIYQKGIVMNNLEVVPFGFH